MAKTRKKAIPTGGYSSWSTARTLREAENVSRWNPWLAHLWMEEARNSINLDNPLYTDFNDVAARINSYWRIISRFHWYNEETFWEAIDRPPTRTYITSIGEDIEFAKVVDTAFT